MTIPSVIGGMKEQLLQGQGAKKGGQEESEKVPQATSTVNEGRGIMEVWVLPISVAWKELDSSTKGLVLSALNKSEEEMNQAYSLMNLASLPCRWTILQRNVQGVMTMVKAPVSRKGDLAVELWIKWWRRVMEEEEEKGARRVTMLISSNSEYDQVIKLLGRITKVNVEERREGFQIQALGVQKRNTALRDELARWVKYDRRIRTWDEGDQSDRTQGVGNDTDQSEDEEMNADLSNNEEESEGESVWTGNEGEGKDKTSYEPQEMIITPELALFHTLNALRSGQKGKKRTEKIKPLEPKKSPALGKKLE